MLDLYIYYEHNIKVLKHSCKTNKHGVYARKYLLLNSYDFVSVSVVTTRKESRENSTEASVSLSDFVSVSVVTTDC